MTILKRCPGCSEYKPVTEFNRNRASVDGLQYRCKPCQIDANRTWAERHPEVRRATLHRQYLRERVHGRRESKESPPEKRRAHKNVERAIRAGHLTRPDACPRCGTDRSPVHAHHEDYSRPLDVQWLCARCHGRLHRDMERSS